MFELFMYVYSCNALSARFFDVDRALNSYIMIIIIRSGTVRGSTRGVENRSPGTASQCC